VKKVLQNFRTFMRISTNFKPVLYMIITVRPDYCKFCASWILKMPPCKHKTQGMASAFVDFFKISQRWRWISQSRHMSKRQWNLGFICECWNQRAVKGVDAHIFTKQLHISVVCLPKSWWQLFSGIVTKCWWWIFTFGCCILLHIYPTGSLWCRQSQQSFDTLTHYM
jgi:hypothetical protein